jgi:DNA-binding GntR family transcriptional regulator
MPPAKSESDTGRPIIKMKEKAYVCIKDKILDCEYMPGQSINEKQIAALLNMGRTPVREALISLQIEGLVEIIPRSDSRAKAITIAQTIELYQLRKLIEPATVIQYRNKIDSMRLLEHDETFKKISQTSGHDNDIAFNKQDIAFHRFLIDSAKNTWLSKIFGEIMQHTYRLGIFNAIQGNNNTRMETYSDHHSIIQALLMENIPEIEKAFSVHINRSRTFSLKSLYNAGITE